MIGCLPATAKPADIVKACSSAMPTSKQRSGYNLKAFSLVSSYNFEKANEISQRIHRLKNHQDTYCSNCGAVISAKAKLCPKCFNETKRIVERPSREILKEEIKTLPFLQIGKKYGVTDNAVRKWCKFYNLPSKKQDIKKYTDDEWSKI